MIKGERTAKNTKGIQGPILKNLLVNQSSLLPSSKESTNQISLNDWKGKDIEKNWEIKKEEEKEEKDIEILKILKENNLNYFKTKGKNLILKERIIDLISVGFKEDFLDNEPDISIEDYFKFENEKEEEKEEVENDIFKFTANLLDENEEIVHSFEKNIKKKEKKNNKWERISHTFKSYGQGIRFVQFIHGSENNSINIIGSSIILSPQTILNEVINKPIKFKKQIKNWKKIEYQNNISIINNNNSITSNVSSTSTTSSPSSTITSSSPNNSISKKKLSKNSLSTSSSKRLSLNNNESNGISSSSLSSLSNIPNERSSFSFIEYKDNFYLFGGCNENRFFFDFYKYNIKKNEWKRLKNELKLKRSHHSCSIYKNKMLISGGMKLTNYLSDFYEYNFDNEKWSKLSSLPLGPLRGHKSLIYKDSLYIFGGSRKSSNLHYQINRKNNSNGEEDEDDFEEENENKNEFYQFSNSLLRFDLLTLKWEIIESSTNNIISGRESFTFIEFKDKFYIFGGLTSNGISNELFTFDLLTKEWNKIEYSGPNLKERCYHSSIILKEKLFIFGGYNSKDGWLNEFYEFDLNTNIFSSIENKGSNIPSQRSGHTMLHYDDKVWIFGGFSAPNEYFNDLYFCK